MFLLGIFGYLALIAALAGATQGGAKLGARWLGVPDFRWFDAQPARVAWWRPLAVRLASALASLSLCVGLFWCGFFLGGEQVPTTTVHVYAGRARDAGMLDGDRVVSIDGAKIDTWTVLRASVKAGFEHQIEIERGGTRSVLRVTPNDQGRIGVAPQERNAPLGVVDSARRAAVQPLEIMSSTIRSVTTGPSGPAELRGPVGIVRESAKDAGVGLPALLVFLGSIGSYLWPYLASLQLFDAATLLLFRKTHPAANRTDSIWRLARLQQALVLALASLVVLLALLTLAELGNMAILALPETLLLMPAVLALFPLTWLAGAQLWGIARSSAILAPGMLIPCVIPIAALVLLLRAREELRAKGFRIGLLVVTEQMVDPA